MTAHRVASHRGHDGDATRSIRARISNIHQRLRAQIVGYMTPTPRDDDWPQRSKQIHAGVVVLIGLGVLGLTWVVVGEAEATIILWAEMVLMLVVWLR